MGAIGGEGLLVIEASAAHGAGEHGVTDDGDGVRAAGVFDQISDAGRGVAVGFACKDVATLGEHEAPVFGDGGGSGYLFVLMNPCGRLVGGFQDGL